MSEKNKISLIELDLVNRVFNKFCTFWIDCLLEKEFSEMLITLHCKFHEINFPALLLLDKKNFIYFIEGCQNEWIENDGIFSKEFLEKYF